MLGQVQGDDGTSKFPSHEMDNHSPHTHSHES